MINPFGIITASKIKGERKSFNCYTRGNLRSWSAFAAVEPENVRGPSRQSLLHKNTQLADRYKCLCAYARVGAW